MELKETIEILKARCEYYKKVNECGFDHNQEYLALDKVLQVLDMPEEEVVFYGTRSAGKTLKSKRTYEMGLIVGTKRERVYWEEKIKKKIAELKHADFLKLQLCYKHDNKAVAQVEALEELLKGEQNNG